MKLTLFAATLALGIAFAQDTPPTTPPAQDTQQNPPAKAKSTTPSVAPDAAKPAEMKTSTFKGELVDMSCASPSSAASSNEAASKTSSADRSGGCNVSSNSSDLGMKLSDGHTVKFDLVGNQRAQDALKNDKRWAKELQAGRPIHATVSGALSGDKLIVSSIR